MKKQSSKGSRSGPYDGAEKINQRFGQLLILACATGVAVEFLYPVVVLAEFPATAAL